MPHLLIRPPISNPGFIRVVKHSEGGYTIRPDDGKPAWAIIGLDGLIPTVWHGDCNCGFTKGSLAEYLSCPISYGMEYCALRYGAANGRVVDVYQADDLDRAIANLSLRRCHG